MFIINVSPLPLFLILEGYTTNNGESTAKMKLIEHNLYSSNIIYMCGNQPV